jgi:hypothetical protein
MSVKGLSGILKVYSMHLTSRFKRKNYKWHANIHAEKKCYIGASRVSWCGGSINMSWYIINHCVHPFILVHVSSG